MTEYKATIGIECHVQLKTKSKLFSGAANDAREAASNSLVNHIDFGLPGALPVLNKAALTLAAKAALALNTRPQLFSKFDRKHYFYPDLPMGYQITQYDQPIIIGGRVEYMLDGVKKVVNITRAHLESDAGKSTHPAGQHYSLVDLNRAGTPLLEIVSEPDMHSAAEAKAYTKELYLLMKYADVTEGDLFYGNMRFDVNVSISKTSKLGTRSETKNLNSFRSVEKVVEYEIKRQTDILDRGEIVAQETRGWNDAKMKTLSQRTKENADDYRYMPDPDLPPIKINENFINNIEVAMPMLPNDWRLKLANLGLMQDQIEALLEANVELPEAEYLKLLLTNKNDIKQLANWLVNIDIPHCRDTISKTGVDRQALYSSVSLMSASSKLSSSNAKELIIRCLDMLVLPQSIEQYANENALIQQSDVDELTLIVDEVISANPKAVDDLRQGESKVIGFLIGQVMAKSKGQANPGIVKKLLIAKII